MRLHLQNGLSRISSGQFALALLKTAAASLFFLSAGCSVAESGIAASEGTSPSSFSPIIGDSFSCSPNAELISSQIVLIQAMAKNDSKMVFRACSDIVNHPGFSSSLVEAVTDAVSWLIAGEHMPEAEELLEVASIRLKDNFDLLALRADLFVQSDKQDEALALMREYCSSHPQDMRAKSALATLMIRNGQIKEALTIQESIPEKDFTAEMRFAYAQALHMKGDFASAEKQLRIALRTKKDFPEAMTLLALTLEKNGKNAEAEEYYEKILENDDGSPSSRLLLLRLYLLDEKIDKAVQAVLSSEDPVKFAVSAASIAMDEKNFNAPVRFLEKLEQRSDLAGELYFYHASLLYAHGMGAENALRILDKINYEDSNFISAAKLKTQILLDKKNPAAAYSMLEKLIKEHPEDIGPIILAGDTYAQQKQYAKAEHFYRKALELDPGHAYAQYQLAYQKELQGLREQALDMMERIININPKNSLALNFIAYHLAEHDQDLDKALDYAARAVAIEPQADFMLDTLAWVHYKRKEYDEAWKNIQKAHMLHSMSGEQDPVLLEHVGDIASAVGAAAAARKGWQDAIARFKHQGQEADALRVRRKLENLQ